MQDVCNKLWTLDAKLVILAWKNEDARPIQKTTPFPNCRDMFAEFTEKIYLKHGQNVWIRLHIGHDKSLAPLREERMLSHFRGKDMLVYKDNLQVKTTAKAGWLLGSHATVLNARDLEAAIGLLPEMKGIPIEIRTEWIVTEKGVKTGLKAAHVLCEWKATLACRRGLNAIYGKTTEGYPLGRNMRFVPNITDTRFITTSKTATKVALSVKKQRRFNESVSSCISYTISDLDFYDDDLGKTLRQVLMQMRSKKHPERNLFLAIDTSWNGAFVTFLYKKDLEREANSIIPALPLVLQAKLGARVWNWFTEEARINTNGYWWDPRKGVRAIGDDDEDSWGDSLASNDDDEGYWSATSGASAPSRASSTGTFILEPFEITEGKGTNEYDGEDDGVSVGAWSSVSRGQKSQAPTVTDDVADEDMGSPAVPNPTLRSALKGSSPATALTSPVSTLSPANSASAQAALIQRMHDDPQYASELMAQFSLTPKAPYQPEPDVMIVDTPGPDTPVTPNLPPANPPTESEGGGN